MTTLGKRLDALEQLAEECRRREWADALRAEITRRYTAEGMRLTAEQVDAKLVRALALADRMEALVAAGLTLDGIACRMAIEHDLEPDRVLAIFQAIRTERA